MKKSMPFISVQLLSNRLRYESHWFAQSYKNQQREQNHVKKNFDYLILQSILSIRAAQPAGNGQKMPFNVLSADTARANNRGSVLGMIQYHHSIFDISVRGELVSRFHLTELRQPTRKFVRTLFPAWFSYRTIDVNWISGSREHVYSWITITRVFIISLFYVRYKNWIFLRLTRRKSDVSKIYIQKGAMYLIKCSNWLN